MRLASKSLEECFGLDSGLFLFKKRVNRLDVHEGGFSLYAPWGEFASVFPSPTSIDAPGWNAECLNRWIPREDWAEFSKTFPFLSDVLATSELQYIGAWSLMSDGEIIGALVAGASKSKVLPEPDIMNACTAQIMMILDTALIRFKSQVAQSFIDHSVDAMTALDVDGTLVQANQAYQKLFGWSAEEIIGVKTPAATNEMRKAFFRFVKDAQNGLPFRHKRGFMKHKDGSLRPVLVTWFAIRDEGKLAYIGVIIRDMSELERLHAELNKTRFMYESLFKNTADAIIILDNTGRVRRVNPAYEKQTGWSSDEVVGRFLRTLPNQEGHEFKLDLERVRQGTQIVGKRTTRIRKDGSRYHVSVTMSPILDRKNQINGISIIKRDITREVETEESLRRSEKLAVAGTLAASVAHEIRNPLTTVKGFLQLLKPDLSHREREYQLMISEITQMEQIINEFLLLAKPSPANKIEVNFPDFMADIVALMKAKAHMHNVHIECRNALHTPIICCDAMALRQVVVNLLKNSIEAFESNSSGGTIQISMEQDDKSTLIVRIRDDGPGMSDEQIARLGEPFYTTKERGTGLGLMVCRRILMNLNGEFHIESQVGHGTTVTIQLPFQSADAEQKQVSNVIP
jgi:PAS domain S-box-containing protein